MFLGSTRAKRSSRCGRSSWSSCEYRFLSLSNVNVSPVTYYHVLSVHFHYWMEYSANKTWNERRDANDPPGNPFTPTFTPNIILPFQQSLFGKYWVFVLFFIYYFVSNISDALKMCCTPNGSPCLPWWVLDDEKANHIWNIYSNSRPHEDSDSDDSKQISEFYNFT